jgi:hypothetical protein
MVQQYANKNKVARASVSAIKMDLLFSIASVNSSVTISAAMVGLSPLVNPFGKALCVLRLFCNIEKWDCLPDL